MKVNRHATAALLVAVAIGGVGGCGGPSTTTPADSSSPAAGGPAAPTTVSTGAATPTVSVTPTTAASLALTTPKAAAEHLYDAWRANDRLSALEGASAIAVDTLFSEAWTADTYFFGGCTRATAPAQCQYNWAAGTIIMMIDGDAVQGFRVTATSFDTAG